MLNMRGDLLSDLDQLSKQHSDLFQILRNCDAVDDYTQANALIKELIKHINHHFRCEEQFMEYINFPNILEHKKIHSRLISSLYELAIRGETNRLTQSVFLKRVRGIIREHVEKIDIEIEVFLNGRIMCSN